MESKILVTLGIDPAFILLFLLILIVVLFVLYVNLTVKYNKLQSSYNTFMKGRNGKTLEESLKEKFGEVDSILKITKQNRSDIKDLFKKYEKGFQKTGIVKYDAFTEMGGKLSFALALLDEKNNGFIINSVHSSEGCYSYTKRVKDGDSQIALSNEEKVAVERAVNGNTSDNM